MAKATAEVTVYQSKSVKAVYRYYLLQTTKPSKPTTYPPATTWVLTEPSYTEGSTNNLYFVDCTVFTNGSFLYSDVSISAAYEASKLAYNKALDALSSANTTASSLAAWCHENDRTLINGSKIYTGTITADQIASKTITAEEIAAEAITSDKIAAKAITADKLNVDSLQAISANIGGFTIEDEGLSAGEYASGKVRLATDGIYTFNWEGSTITRGNVTNYIQYSSLNNTIISSGGLQLRLYEEDGFLIDQCIVFSLDNLETLKIKHDGIYNATKPNTALPVIGIIDTDVVDIGQTARLHGDLYMDTYGNIGTIDYPTGSHVMANNKYLYGLNSDGGRERIIGITDSDNMVIGSSSGKKGNIFTYINTSGSFSVNDGVGYVFGTYMSEEDNTRYFRCVPISEQTTTGGTAVRVGSTGLIYKYTSSSMRYKEEITQKLNESLDPERLYDLGVYQYKYREGHISKNDQRYDMTHIGFLAEDVKYKYPIAANYNENGEVEDWSERYIIPAMLKLIQNQNKEIQNIKAILEKGNEHENNQSGNS